MSYYFFGQFYDCPWPPKPLWMHLMACWYSPSLD